ncbi:MAG: YcxB family protein [Candidatus Gastranaerophilaceae bacterium]
MKVSYEFTLEDCKTYVKETFFIKRLFSCFIKDNLRRAVICGLLLSFSFACILFSFSIKPIIILFIITFIGAYVIWGLMGYFSGGKYAYRMLDGLDKNYELTIENDIIKRNSASGQSTFTWDNVKDIYNTKRSILIFVSDRMAIVVPKRIFNSEQEVNDFWNCVLSCYQNASR